MPARRDRQAWIVPGAVFSAVLALELWMLGRAILPGLDEGIYLYAARLIVHGQVPYRDFFLSHPPLAILGAAGGLLLTGFRIQLFDGLYAAWCLTTVFPLWRVATFLTGRRTAGFVAVVLFVTFPELVRWDLRYFALRQASLPLLAFGLEAFVVRRRPVPAGILLGLFACCVVTQVPIAGVLVVALAFLPRPHEAEGSDGAFRRSLPFLAAFGITVGLGYAAVLAIPNAWYDLFLFQIGRPPVPLADRARKLYSITVAQNAPLLLAGLLGSFPRRDVAGALGLTTLITLPVVLLGPRSYYPHYVSSFALLLALSGAFLAVRLPGPRLFRPAAPVALVTVALLFAFVQLRGPFSFATPATFRVIEALRRVPDPILCYEPIFALHSGREITPHPHAADMRAFRVTGRPPLDDAAFFEVLSRSASVLVEPFLAGTLTPPRRAALERDFGVVFAEPREVVLVRTGRSGAPPVSSPVP